MKVGGNTILITGAAGFIGAALAKNLIQQDENIIGLDNLNTYYDKNLKIARIDTLKNNKNWKFYQASIDDNTSINNIFKNHKPNIVVNLAAQAGVRNSLKDPISYVESNISGFVKILECCRKYNVENFIYASSSSVYGQNASFPSKEVDPVDHPISLYAASKRSNELIAHSYSHLFKIPCTGLRFFSVYGPWGRPDMAPIIFAKSILERTKISVFNQGKMKRDFTYIDDVIEAISKCCYKPASSNLVNDENLTPNISLAPYRLFNIGFGQKIDLLYFIKLLEQNLGETAIKNLLPAQPGDALATGANNSLLNEWINFQPKVSIEEGIEKFILWFKDYYKYK
tara:strand:- start:1359 stop:2381 length:1023 start_codon:yes stop_codon:yes gene_type:complete